MNRLRRAFQHKDKLLNIYITAGYPALADSGPLVQHLADAGVDIIEIGMPYSDPMADGPTIQETSAKALANGLTLDILFSQLQDIRSVTSVPLIFMGYLNQMMQYGIERFLDECATIGIDALIIPDLPPELYERDYQQIFQSKGIEIIFLITPQTSEDRIRKIDNLSNSFIYVVSRSSITGSTQDITSDQEDYFRRIADMNLDNPTMIGFGISDHASYEKATMYADGAIIGSAFLKYLKQHSGSRSLDDITQGFVSIIRNG